MGDRARGLAALATALLLLGGAGLGFAADKSSAKSKKPRSLTAVVARGAVAVETVRFADRKQAPVQVLRGLPRPPLRPAMTGGSQIVSFGTGFVEQVTVVRGGLVTPARLDRRIEKVAFADPALPAVTVVRGPTRSPERFAIDLFGPADGGELDRIVFAVDGIESRHGADPRMWRPGLDGPQGPMQVSAAAALDVGGGDRFDLRQNRLLGRAYLAQMFRRYGNWRDALAAYNWGPGNLDQWIAAGRDPDRLPPGVAYYITRALRDALIATAGLF